MEKISSFRVDHDRLLPGLYVSRRDGDVVTYDIRTRKPNGGSYMTNPVMHTVEHLFATYARNGSFGREVIYFGPMGCRTGFYFLVRDAVSAQDVISLVTGAFRFIASYEGEIPGAKRKECGNWMEHDPAGAREEAKRMLDVLKDWTPQRLSYAENGAED